MTAQPKYGSYVLLNRLSVGAIAEVFLAAPLGHPDGPKVVIKRLLPHAEEDHDLVCMFLSEASIASQLSHPNVAQVVEHGRVEGSNFIAMEHVSGHSLSDYLKRLVDGDGSLSELEVIAVGAQTAAGLAYVHGFCSQDGAARNIVHRDLTPGNILLSTAGVIKIVDFGIATFRGRQHSTRPGIRKGKAAYMSPEQIRGEPTDARSDLFSLGVVLHELVSARRLFKESDVYRTFERIEAGDVSKPDTLEESSELWSLLSTCLAATPSKRPDRAAVVQHALEAILGNSSGLAGKARLKSLSARFWSQGAPAREKMTLSQYHAGLTSAEERGEETTDQKEVSDITLVRELGSFDPLSDTGD